ncbi:MAG: hypothetical protein KDI55_02395 [Anaerolineae bacterium]|nr:hypothetical protein [Anaerolineae bacterium]MCP5428527.1 hypothetical protein [Chromatiaceae bacterium]
MAAKTAAERQAERRDRLSAGGLFRRRDIWVHPDDEPEIRALEARLRRRRLKSEDDDK